MKEFERQGDKENSKFFEDHLQKIYERREKSGIDDLVEYINAVVIQVEHQEALKYLMELYLMTPYRFHKGYTSETHKIYILKNHDKALYYIVLEPLEKNYHDNYTSVSEIYPRGSEKSKVKYIGEIYKTKNSKELQAILESQQFRFQSEIKNQFLANENFLVSEISYYTNNSFIYCDLENFNELNFEKTFDLNDEEKNNLDKANEVHVKYGLDKLIFGIDHLATRVFCGGREDAILEFLSMTNYYFWGAFNIDEMNSSTNVNRNPNVDTEIRSPAKVFTANNVPYYVNSIENKKSPTEDFVRNFGKRMHHIAYAVEDGAREDGTKNIDYVVGKLMSENIPFLAKIIGECKDFPDLKQIFSKTSEYSFLITEYVQRCKGFKGFFTKANVAYLTQAAGEDEKVRKSGIYD